MRKAQIETVIIVGIAGGSGSGKSTICGRLQKMADRDSATIMHDSYYRCLSRLPDDQRADVNFDHPDSLDTQLLCRHLDQLRAGQAVAVPSYCFKQHVRTAEVQRIEPVPIVFVDGVLVLSGAELRERLDFAVFVHVDTATRLQRRIARDTVDRGRSRESVIRQWETSVLPMHEQFVAPSREYAGFEIDNTATEPPDLSSVATAIFG